MSSPPRHPLIFRPSHPPPPPVQYRTSEASNHPTSSNFSYPSFAPSFLPGPSHGASTSNLLQHPFETEFSTPYQPPEALEDAFVEGPQLPGSAFYSSSTTYFHAPLSLHEIGGRAYLESGSGYQEFHQAAESLEGAETLASIALEENQSESHAGEELDFAKERTSLDCTAIEQSVETALRPLVILTFKNKFVSILFVALENPVIFGEAISWDESGTQVIVHEGELLNQILGILFDHKQVKVLNHQFATYSFQQLQKANIDKRNRRRIWKHPDFRRNSTLDELRRIRPKELTERKPRKAGTKTWEAHQKAGGKSGSADILQSTADPSSAGASGGGDVYLTSVGGGEDREITVQPNFLEWWPMSVDF